MNMKLSRYKHDSEFSYTFGATLTYELLKTHPELIQRVFLRPNTSYGDELKAILSEIKRRQIEIVESTKAFNILGTKENCLLIAEFRKTSTPLDPRANHIVLVNPSDSGNLGTIMRSAVGFGYENLAIITPAVDHFNPKAIRASMGAFAHLNIAYFDTFDTYMTQYPNRTNYSFMLRRAKPLNEILSQTVSQPYSLVFGNEAAGLSDNYADFTTPVFIPQNQKIDSLNLSVAASIAMFEFSNCH